MAPAWFTLRLFVCAVILTERLGETAVANLDCPSEFTDKTDTTVTYTVDSAGITNAICFADTRVVFNFVPKDKTSELLCSHPYPPTSCSDFKTSDTCGCSQQGAAGYTYKYILPAQKSMHSGGQIKATLCVSPSGPFEEESSSSCNNITFEAPPCEKAFYAVVTVTVVAELAFVVLIVLGVLLWLSINLPCTCCRRITRFLAALAVVAVLMLILCAVALGLICKGYPHEDTCETMCVVNIVLTVTDSGGIVVIVIVVVFKPTPQDPQEPQDPPEPQDPTGHPDPTIPVTIISDRLGKLSDSYALKWAVPDEDKANIKKFTVTYGKVDVDPSREPWKPKQWPEVTENTTVGGKNRRITIENLTANTFYGVKIKVEKRASFSEGPPFVFKTAFLSSVWLPICGTLLAADAVTGII